MRIASPSRASASVIFILSIRLITIDYLQRLAFFISDLISKYSSVTESSCCRTLSMLNR